MLRYTFAEAVKGYAT